MIELDIINPSDDLRAYIVNVWPDDEYMYVHDEGEHYYIKCDDCTFWDGNYTITLKYGTRAIVRMSLYKGEFEQVRSINKNKRGIYNDN